MSDASLGPAPPGTPIVDLIVLAGGRGERLGGYDKATLVVDGRTLLDHVLAADLGGRVVVVGQTEVPDGIPRTLEDPPGGGPAAGIGAGLDALAALADGVAPAVWVAVAAVDQPGAGTILDDLRRRLENLPDDVDALCRRDPEGRRQWLLAIYRRPALVDARARLGSAHNAAVRSLVADLRWREVDAAAQDGAGGDIDTWADLAGWGDRTAGPSIRAATPADVKAIAAVRVAAWLTAYRGLLPQPLLDRLDVPGEAEHRLRVWDEQHRDPRVCELVAEMAGQVVGWAVAGPSRDETRPDDGELLGLYAHPQAWGAGVGHRLLEAVEEHLRAREYPRAYLWVLEGNTRAEGFYERHGWREDGTTQLDHRGGYALRERRRVRTLG